MLEWMWVCMVLSFKAALGSFFWVIAILFGLMVITFLFGLIGSVIEGGKNG